MGRGESPFPFPEVGSIFHPWPGTTARHPQWPQLSAVGRTTLLPSPILLEQGEALTPNFGGKWAPKKPLWNSSTARKAQWRTSCLVGFFQKEMAKGSQEGISTWIPVHGAWVGAEWHALDMLPLALLSWHSFLPGERAPQHHVRLPGAAASQAQIVLMSLAFCKSLPFFNFGEKQNKKSSAETILDYLSSKKS